MIDGIYPRPITLGPLLYRLLRLPLCYMVFVMIPLVNFAAIVVLLVHSYVNADRLARRLAVTPRLDAPPRTLAEQERFIYWVRPDYGRFSFLFRSAGVRPR